MMDQLFMLPRNVLSVSSSDTSEGVDVLKVDFKEELTITESTENTQQESKKESPSNKELLQVLKNSLEAAQKNISQAISAINASFGDQFQQVTQLGLDNFSEILTKTLPLENPPHVIAEGSITEGVFDGQHMIGANGKQYTIPANYASKSKLVEGDTLKLTITPQGSFIYKQIHPIERRRLLGMLEFNADTREYCVRAESRAWRVLTASITYYKGIPGDEVAIIIPKEALSAWGAVEHIIKRVEGEGYRV